MLSAKKSMPRYVFLLTPDLLRVLSSHAATRLKGWIGAVGDIACLFIRN